MNAEMNLEELDTILKESPSPAMQLDPEKVLIGGRGRRRRRRSAIGGGVLGGVLLLSTAGFVALRPTTGEPMPGADPTNLQVSETRAPAPAGSYYDMSDPAKKPGQLTFVKPSVAGAREPVEVTVQITKVNGILRLAQVKKSAAGSTTADLPIIKTLPGGLVVTRIGDSTVAAMPTPLYISRATLTGRQDLTKQNATTNTGLLLKDGTPVTVFASARPVDVTGAYWPRDRSIETNDGKVITPTRIDDRYSAFVIENLGIRGVIESNGRTATQELSQSAGMLGVGTLGGPYFWGRWFTSKPSNVRFEWKGLTGTAPTVTTVRAGDTNWWMASVSTNADAAKAKVIKVTWTDASGTHTDTNP